MVTASDFRGRDVVSIKDFDREELEFLLNEVDLVAPAKALSSPLVALLFFEASTRTHSSFEIAAQSLGCRVTGFANPGESSVSKGETLHDTIRMFEGYGVECIVVRHSKMGAAKFAADVARVPVINAGDGSREHPTQAMVDLYTIRKALGKLDGLRVGMLGDLKYGRTASSLSYALSNFDVGLSFIAPESLQIRPEVEAYLAERGVAFGKEAALSKVLSELDVLYVTRIQKERIPDPTEYERVRGMYEVNLEALKGAKPTLKVLHPLPRVDELSTDVDASQYAGYFEQAASGLPLRRALFRLILGEG